MFFRLRCPFYPKVVFFRLSCVFSPELCFLLGVFGMLSIFSGNVHALRTGELVHFFCLRYRLFLRHTFEIQIYLLGFRDLVFKGCLNSQVISDKLPVDISEKGFYI